MPEARDISTDPVQSPYDKVLNSYLDTIEDSFSLNQSQFKLINYGTGSGKTHQLFEAICQTIEKYPHIQTIGIYVAPLREHLSVPKKVKDKYPKIPVYKLNSLEMKTSDKYLVLYKQWIPVILTNKDVWKADTKKFPRQELERVEQNLQLVKKAIERLKFVQGFDFGDKAVKDNQVNKARRDIVSPIENFLVYLINSQPDEHNWSNECFKLVEIFFPLYLLRKKFGILMLTYKKFETNISYFKHNSKKWIQKSDRLDKYIVQPANNATKFILALDEQEDGYQIMLEEKIDIISPEDMAINNALSSIYREFALLFAKRNKNNRELLTFLDCNPGAFKEFEEHLEKGKILAPQLQKYLDIYQKISFEEGSSVKFLQNLISINKGIENCFTEIRTIFENDCEEVPIDLNFEMLLRVLAKFENTRSLLIPQKLYDRISNDLMNIFSYNNLYIYNIASLQNLYLKKASGGHVRILDKKVADNTSIAELVYGISVLRSQVKKVKKILANVLDAADSQSRALEIWSKQITKLQKADEENQTQAEKRKRLYLDRQYVYESNKPIVNIKEISRYQKDLLINSQFIEVSIGSTAIFTSPEYKLRSMLKNNANVIFSISATGGIYGDLTTSYDMSYLEDKLRSESGQSSFQAMTESEVAVCEEMRDFRQQQRNITVDFFSQNLDSFPNKKTKQVTARFESLILTNFINHTKEEHNLFYFSKYKFQELSRFIHFLYYLFEDESIQQTIAFTQTLNWIKKLIKYCDNSGDFIFEPSSEHPHIYYVRINHKDYQSDITIKLILYSASFNKEYNAPNNKRTYLSELVEKKGEKIFFISTYPSASKGLNPVIKTKDDREKDFDSLVILTDSYYSKIKSSSKKLNKSKNKDAEKSATIYHFALMKSIVKRGDSSLEIKDFNQYLNTPEASTFRELQHQILLGKTTLQAIGRSERRNFPNQEIKIFINDETKNNLLNLYKYLEHKEENEIRKLSVNNYAVYQRVIAESKKHTINDYDNHIYDEIDADIAFHEFKHEMLDEIQLFHQQKNNFDVRKAWDSLRDATVFKNPAKYLDNLRQLKIFPDEFINSLFYKNDRPSEFIPYLAWEEDNGKKYRIISDSIRGDRIYTYQNRLYPEYIRINSQGYDLEGNEIPSFNSSTKLIGKLYHDLIPQPEVFNSYIPRPSFFSDILYPSLTENFVERWIKEVIFNNRTWQNIQQYYGLTQLTEFQNYPQLYEKFDLYYLKDNVLFCIDVKAWSKSAGKSLSSLTLKKAKEKLKTIAENHQEFDLVQGLLLNLHAPKEKTTQHSSTLFSENLIYFDARNCPVESDALRKFLRIKNK